MTASRVRQSLGPNGDGAPAESAANPAAPDRGATTEVGAGSYYRVRLLLAAAAAVAAFLFWLAAGWLGVPHFRGYEASLLTQPSAVVGLATTAILIVASTAIGSLIAGSVRFDAGLFAAALGMTVLTLRGGPSRYVVQTFDTPAGYLILAVETILIFAFIGLAWYGLWVLHRRGQLLGDVSRDGIADAQTTLGDKMFAAATQAVVTGIVVTLLARTDEKKQVLAAVGIASLVGAMAAYALAPVQRSIWYWGGVMAVAVFGYATASIGGTDGPWHDGPSGTLAGLARPLPLDYASVGTAGAILGYWFGRRGQRTREEASAAGAA